MGALPWSCYSQIFIYAQSRVSCRCRNGFWHLHVQSIYKCSDSVHNIVKSMAIAITRHLRGLALNLLRFILLIQMMVEQEPRAPQVQLRSAA